MQPKSETRDFEYEASQFRKKFLIFAFAFFVLYLAYYLAFAKKVIYPSLIKLFIMLSVGIIFYLFKKLKAEPLPDKAANGRLAQRTSTSKDLSLLNMQDLGFSENTITKSRKLLQTQFNDMGAVPAQGFVGFPKDFRDQPRADRGFQAPDMRPQIRESKPHEENRHDKSIFDHISFDWPSNLSSSRMRAQQSRPFQSTYKETTINENGFGMQRESSLVRQGTTVQSVRRGPSNDGLRRVDSKPSQSKAKYTLHKNSITSKSDIRRDTVPQYDKITESDMALQTSLVAMNVSLEKFNVWAFHNIQVWLAFNFIPELLERNLV